MKITLAGGLSLIGSVDDTDAGGSDFQLRQSSSGAFAANTHTSIFSADRLGFGFDTGADDELTFQALEGNNITGAKFTGYLGDPNSFWSGRDHLITSPIMDTPQAIAARAFKNGSRVSAPAVHLGLWYSGPA